MNENSLRNTRNDAEKSNNKVGNTRQTVFCLRVPRVPQIIFP